MQEEMPSRETIDFVTLLTGMQVVYNAQLALKDTRFYQGTVRERTRKAIDSMEFAFKNNYRKIWKIDEKQAADMMMAVETMAEMIVNGNSLGLAAVATLMRSDLDLSRVVVKELTDEEIDKTEESEDQIL